MTKSAVQAPEAEARARQGLAQLRAKLLDLTTRNKMLSYRHPSAGCLRVVDELPDQLYNELIGGKNCVFEPVPEPKRTELDEYYAPIIGEPPKANPPPPVRPDAATWAKYKGIHVDYEMPVMPGGPESPRHQDRKIQTLHYADPLEALLNKIRLAARTAIEESGANMLHFAFGFLDWRDPGADRGHLAPLILLPVGLERKAEASSYRTNLRYTGEVLQTNLSLQKKLEEFDLKLPDLRDGQAPEDYFTAVTRTLRDRAGWRVRRYVTLGLFDFGKFLLYRDLDPELWPEAAPLTGRPLVRQVLLGSQKLGDTGSGAEEAATEEQMRFRDTRLELVDRADSSQCEALEQALTDRDLVIQGPPGTGKSQTITNLIAAALSRGKTVLFVAEKLAALEVVRRRLRELGLNDFCLELHSHKTRKAEVIKDIGRRLEAAGHAHAPRQYQDALGHLIDLRQDIADYIALIALPAGMLGDTTVRDALMAAGHARRKLGPNLPVYEHVVDHFEAVTRLTRRDVDAAIGRLKSLRASFRELGVSRALNHPWAGVSSSAALAPSGPRIARAAAEWATAAEKLSEARVGAWASVSVTELTDARGALDWITPLRPACAKAERLMAEVEGLLAIELPRSARGLAAVQKIPTLAANAPAVAALALRTAATCAPGAGEWIASLEARISDLRDRRDRLGASFKASAFETDQDELEEWSAALSQKGWVARFGKRWRAAARAWKERARPAAIEVPRDQKIEAMEALRAFLKDAGELEADARLKAKLGDHFAGLDTPVVDLRALADWCAAIRDSIPGDAAAALITAAPEALRHIQALDEASAREAFGLLCATLGRAAGEASSLWALLTSTLPADWRKLALDVKTEPEWESLLAAAATLSERTKAYEDAKAAFVGMTSLDWAEWLPETTEDVPSAVAARALRAAEVPEALPVWLRFDAARAACSGVLERAVAAPILAGAVSPDAAEDGVDFVVYDGLARAALANAPRLRQFAATVFEQLREEYRGLDAKVMELRRAEIASRLYQKKPLPGTRGGSVRSLTQEPLIEAELAKQRAHLPVRTLIERAGESIQQLKPCFMMGPLSVAQYIAPGELEFDLVVMDEASQMLPEDAVGALARARQAVIVGDSKQLPPTSFFERVGQMANDDTEEDGAEDGGLIAGTSDSILDWAAGAFTKRMLRWHYRSRHESLIAFSNRRFYENKLVVFPSPSGEHGRFGVGWRYVTDGCATKGVNANEARTVARAVADMLLQHSGRSIGVVAMNVNQAQRIVDELAILEGSDRALAEARLIAENDGRGEPFFIKNLENVQGDERDIIVISMTYGPSRPNGPTPQNFGPINQQTGWRRLNVLFTRAKERMEVFSSMRPADVVPSDGSADGPRALRAFLEYASGEREGRGKPGDKPPDSPFEEVILEGLRGLGFDCQPQLGVAGFFLDIAVRDPNRPETFIAGIECDGATYHSTKSARDRDRLRQEILEQLGWTILRVWSPDWYADPARVLDRLAGELRTLTAARATQHEPPGEPPAPASTAPEERPPVPAALSGAGTAHLSPDQARAKLIDLRENAIKPAFPDADPTRGLLRKTMLDVLLRARPADLEEFRAKIPRALREETDSLQLRVFGDRVFEMLARIAD